MSLSRIRTLIILSALIACSRVLVGREKTIRLYGPTGFIEVDTIDNRAGLGLWTREEFARYHVLRPD